MPAHREASPKITCGDPILSSLAVLSPYHDARASQFIFVASFVVAMLSFGLSVIDVLGVLGSLLIVIGIAGIVQRLTQPIVLQLLGLHAYKQIEERTDSQTAYSVAMHYSRGRNLTEEEFKALEQHSQKKRGA